MTITHKAPLKALLFDLDGTLANTLPLCIKVYQQALERSTGRPFTEDEVTAHFGLTEEGIFRKLLPETWKEALHDYHITYEKSHNECQEPFPGIPKALSLLKDRDVAMGIVTGKGIHTALYTLNYLNIAHYFRAVEAGSTDAIVKASAIKKMLTDWNIDPQHAAYIGDSDSDIREATIAGVLPLAATWAETETIHRLQDIQPAHTFKHVDHLIEWIQEKVYS